MLYIILLLILAVLLFGSGVVIGFLGYVLGFIVAAIALFWLSVTYQIDAVIAILFGIVGFFALCGLVILLAKLIEPWEQKRLMGATSKRSKEMEATLAKMTPDERQRFVDEKIAALRK